MKVNFIIIGAQKSGTTSLAARLARHSQVCFCRIKEPALFHRPVISETALARYHSLFKPKPGQLLGEASVAYTTNPARRDEARIHAYNPRMKLVYIMRDPVGRIESQYAHRLARGRVRRPVEEEIKDVPYYLLRSRYYSQLTPYLKLFGRESLFLDTFERLVGSPGKVLGDLARFLEIDPRELTQKSQLEHENRSTERLLLPDYGRIAFAGALRRLGGRLPPSARTWGLKVLGRRIDVKPQLPFLLKRTLHEKLYSEILGVESLIGRQLEEWSDYGVEPNSDPLPDPLPVPGQV